MIPVFQTLTTANDGTGNCFIACVASILEMPLREVPNISSDMSAGLFWPAIERWLIERGLFLNHRGTAPKGWAIGGGQLETSDGLVQHAVVVFNGAPIHDPYPLGGKFTDPDSFWSIDPITDDQRDYCDKQLQIKG